jgi:cell wall-associated NlpC family hydrolase
VATGIARRIRPIWVAAVVVVLAVAGLLTPGFASANPGSHHPQSIAAVQQRLGRLVLRNTQLVEKFNQARLLVQQRQAEAEAAQASADKAQAALDRANTTFEQMVQAQYETGQLSAAGALLSSDNGNNYLDRLATLDLMSNRDADVVAMLDHARRDAAQQNEVAQQALAAATEQRDAVLQQRHDVARQMSKYKRLLGVLTARQQAAYLHEVSPAVTASRLERLPIPGTKADRVAVDFALRQVGKPYVFGSAGPSSFDCSGLTMAAWHAAGVALPHSAAGQAGYGHHVAESQLRPGDLIFFYQPIDHVTIYIGDGLMVSAPTEGMPVQVVPLSYFQSDYAGATRLG